MQRTVAAALVVGLVVTVAGCESNQPAYEDLANTGLERADLQVRVHEAGV